MSTGTDQIETVSAFYHPLPDNSFCAGVSSTFALVYTRQPGFRGPHESLFRTWWICDLSDAEHMSHLCRSIFPYISLGSRLMGFVGLQTESIFTLLGLPWAGYFLPFCT